MKKKSLFTILAIAIVFILSLSGLAACNENGEHNFSEEWSNDENHHWHACADKDCKETKDKAEHSWNGGNVTVEPTTEQKGTMVYICTVSAKRMTIAPTTAPPLPKRVIIVRGITSVPTSP